MIVSWSGWGWLTLVIGFGSLVLGTWLGGPVDDGWGKVLLLEVGLLVGAVLNLLLAMSVNSRRTPNGRVWVQDHTLWRIPVQGHTVSFLALMWLTLAVSAGRLIAPAAGWAVVAVTAALGVAALVRHRGLRARRDATPSFAAWSGPRAADATAGRTPPASAASLTGPSGGAASRVGPPARLRGPARGQRTGGPARTSRSAWRSTGARRPP